MSQLNKKPLKVMLFAQAKELAQNDCVELDLESGATVAEIRQHLMNRVPALIPLMLSCRFAVNDTFVTEDHVVEQNDDVALIPPVSGG